MKVELPPDLRREMAHFGVCETDAIEAVVNGVDRTDAFLRDVKTRLNTRLQAIAAANERLLEADVAAARAGKISAPEVAARQNVRGEALRAEKTRIEQVPDDLGPYLDGYLTLMRDARTRRAMRGFVAGPILIDNLKLPPGSAVDESALTWDFPDSPAFSVAKFSAAGVIGKLTSLSRFAVGIPLAAIPQWLELGMTPSQQRTGLAKTFMPNGESSAETVAALQFLLEQDVSTDDWVALRTHIAYPLTAAAFSIIGGPAAIERFASALGQDARWSSAAVILKNMRNMRVTFEGAQTVWRALKKSNSPDLRPGGTQLYADTDAYSSYLRELGADRAGEPAGVRAGQRRTPAPRQFQGGRIVGPGTETSDSIPVWLSNGEWVLRARAANALGDDILWMLNQWDQLSADERDAVESAMFPANALRRNAGGAAGDSTESGIAGPATSAKIEEFSRQLDVANEALGKATERLAAAKAAFDAYSASVAAGVRQGHDLADAVAAESKAQDALTEALKAQETAHKNLAVARASGTDAQVASATRALAEADQKVAAAKDANGGFLSFLQQGADAATRFATQIDSLRAAGASSEVLQKIAGLGSSSGGSAAGELLAGGSSAVARANYLVQLVADLSQRTGASAAQQYYGPEVASAQSAVDSINATISSLNAQLAAIPPNAKGGIVTAPTIALVGEAGPEAIIPLNRAGALATGSAINVSLVVHGSVVQEQDLAVTVRDNIAQLMRRRGLDPSILGV